MIEISPSAIDQASNRVRGIWLATCEKKSIGFEDEGLHSWLARTALEALKNGDVLPSGKVRWAGMKFGFLNAYRERNGQQWKILTSIERIR